jgi:NADH dehydrogenase
VAQKGRMKKTILVTGSSGFIGRVVVSKLISSGYSVIAMMLPGSIAPFEPHPNLKLIWTDIRDYEKFKDRLKRVDAIVHLAANKYHPKLSYEVNLQGAENLVRLIEEGKTKGKRIINISSQSTKIRFRGVYGESKRLSDEIIQVKDLEWTTLKPSLVYGKGRETLFQTIKGYVEKLPVVPLIGNGKWVLHPIDVEEVAQAIKWCLENPRTIHRVYDLGSAKKIAFDELVNLIQGELKVKRPILHIPTFIGLPAVFLATRLVPTLPISVDNVLGSTQDTKCHPNKANEVLGLNPVSVKEGIKKYLGVKNGPGLKIAVVGLGKMGILHTSILNVLPEVKVTAIVDKNQSLGNTAKSMGINAHFYKTLEEALKNQGLDAVFICTPTFAHKEIINVCDKYKLVYFVEKPAFPQFSDYATVKTSNKNMAGYFWIYRREVKYVKGLLKKNLIGKVKSYSLNLKHSEVFGPKKGWLFRKSLSGGGVLANPAPHAFSLIEYFFKSAEVEKCNLKYLYGNEVEDAAVVGLRHETGIKGVIKANWSVRRHPIMTLDFEIIGTKGAIKFENGALTIRVGKKKDTLQYFQIPCQRRVFNINPASAGDAYYAEDLAFINAISKGSRFVNDMRFAKRVERMINAAYEKANK